MFLSYYNWVFLWLPKVWQMCFRKKESLLNVPSCGTDTPHSLLMFYQQNAPLQMWRCYTNCVTEYLHTVVQNSACNPEHASVMVLCCDCEACSDQRDIVFHFNTEWGVTAHTELDDDFFSFLCEYLEVNFKVASQWYPWAWVKRLCKVLPGEGPEGVL